MDTNTIPSDKEEAGSEEGMLKLALKPFLGQISDIKEGYNLLCLIVNAYRLDFPHVDLKLNNYYLQVLQVTKSAFEIIEAEIDNRYYKRDPSLPSDFIHAQIFEGSFYEPFTSLHEAKQKISGKELSWFTIETKMNECLSRINNAYFRVFANGESVPKNKDLYSEIQGYISGLGSIVEKTNTLICQNLVLDTVKGTLQYATNKPVPVTIDGREIKLLRLLFEYRDRILRYETIATKLDMNFYHESVSNEDAGEEIRYLKRDLVRLLKKVGMESKDINKMLIVQKNIGYRLICGT